MFPTRCPGFEIMGTGEAIASERPLTETRPAATADAELLLEREQELLVLERMVRGAAGGEGGLVVIEGAAGIGKSRLVARLRERAAASGLRVLAARGSDLEREFAFGVVRQLYEPALAGEGERGRLLAGAAASAAPVFDALGGDAGRGDGSFAALHGLYWVTVNLAGDGPLLLAVDDLHWCDRPSLRFLAYLARRLEGLPIVLAVSLRIADPGTDPVLVGELVGAVDATHVRPQPLSGDGVGDMVQARLGAEPAPAFTRACLDATGGNPLLLRQLLTSLGDDGVAPTDAHAGAVRDVGPRAVSRTVLLRLHRLPPGARAVAQAVAVLGDRAELPLVAASAGLGEQEVAQAAAELARAEILRPDALGFAHPLVRDAIYHELPAGERELRHAHAARLLADAQAPAEAVATHLRMAPRRGDGWVVDVLAQAAASARSKGASDSAVAYLARALDEPPAPERRAAILFELGLAETLTSGPSAAAHLREAWGLLEDPRHRALAASILARTLLFTAPAREAAEVASRAADETPPELVDERQALRALAIAAVFYGISNDAAVAHLEDLHPEGDGPGARMLAAVLAFGRATLGAGAEESAALARWALADDVLIEADPGLFPVAAIAVLVLADQEDALAAWEPLRELAHRRGSLVGNLTVNLWRGFTLLRRGDLREAQTSLEAAQEQFADWGRVRSRETYGAAFLAAVRLGRGDLDGARAALASAQQEDDGSNGYAQLLLSRASLLLAEGRPGEALAVADSLSRLHVFATHPGYAPWRSLRAQALDRLGRTDEAIAAAAEELAIARRFGAPAITGRALRVLGTVDREHGLQHLHEAVEVLESSTARLELAEALLALGTALRLTRAPAEAREPLRRALELADRCGADALVAHARGELYATGARPRSTAVRGAAALTPSERRVAELAAEGRSNKDVAQELFVTPKTVEVHLSSAYRKLGITSRRDLGRALTAA
jgi:DNA-binding CsgD family transcriptional regulator